MPRHTHKEFLAFLKTVERCVPLDKIIHAIADNYATRKQPDVLKRLAKS